MNPSPVTVLEEENLYIAYYKLHSNNLEALFVVNKFNTLKGIITRNEIINFNLNKKN
jgi:CBS domain-containing protein